MTFSCIIIDDEEHAIGELSELVERNPKLKLRGTFLDAEEAINYLMVEGGVDIIFSDIRMPKLTGLQAAKLLHSHCRFLVYVTAYRDHSLQAFEENASGYLLKPVNYVAFTELINKFLSQDNRSLSSFDIKNDNLLFVKGDQKNSYISIKTNEICYIKAELNYCNIITNDKAYMTYMLLGQVEEKLKSASQFFRINKSIIISIDHIKNIEGNTVYLDNNESFVIGRKYQAAFFSLIKERSLNF